MAIDDTTVLCGKCKAALKEMSDIQPDQRTPCPKCGSTSRHFEVTSLVSIGISVRAGMKGKHPGDKTPFIEQISGADLFRKIGKWMHLSRVIDRENDQYSEIITDPTTGEIIHKCEEPLSKHTGHGTARQKKDNLGSPSL